MQREHKSKDKDKHTRGEQTNAHTYARTHSVRAKYDKMSAVTNKYSFWNLSLYLLSILSLSA